MAWNRRSSSPPKRPAVPPLKFDGNIRSPKSLPRLSDAPMQIQSARAATRVKSTGVRGGGWQTSRFFTESIQFGISRMYAGGARCQRRDRDQGQGPDNSSPRPNLSNGLRVQARHRAHRARLSELESLRSMIRQSPSFLLPVQNNPREQISPRRSADISVATTADQARAASEAAAMSSHAIRATLRSRTRMLVSHDPQRHRNQANQPFVNPSNRGHHPSHLPPSALPPSLANYHWSTVPARSPGRTNSLPTHAPTNQRSPSNRLQQDNESNSARRHSRRVASAGATAVLQPSGSRESGSGNYLPAIPPYRPGLAPATLAALPSLSTSESPETARLASEDVCSICLEDFSQNPDWQQGGTSRPQSRASDFSVGSTGSTGGAMRKSGGRNRRTSSSQPKVAPAASSMVIRLPNCVHIFHPACIHKWLARSKRCPLCNKPAYQL